MIAERKRIAGEIEQDANGRIPPVLLSGKIIADPNDFAEVAIYLLYSDALNEERLKDIGKRIEGADIGHCRRARLLAAFEDAEHRFPGRISKLRQQFEKAQR